jgi:hypothetical protein
MKRKLRMVTFIIYTLDETGAVVTSLSMREREEKVTGWE